MREIAKEAQERERKQAAKEAAARKAQKRREKQEKDAARTLQSCQRVSSYYLLRVTLQPHCC
jgi:hypothetical protein